MRRRTTGPAWREDSSPPPAIDGVRPERRTSSGRPEPKSERDEVPPSAIGCDARGPYRGMWLERSWTWRTPKVTCNLAHRWMPRKQPHHGHRRGSRARKARPKTEARVPENDAMEIDHVGEPDGRSRVAEDGPDQATRTTLGNPSENPCWNPSRKVGAWSVRFGRRRLCERGPAAGNRRYLGVGGWCPAPRPLLDTLPPPSTSRRARSRAL